MSGSRSWAVFLLSSSFGNAACVEAIPPPAPPAEHVPLPQVKLLPAAPGKGRIVIDVTNGPARVDEIVANGEMVMEGVHGASVGYEELTRPICVTTPCVANFDYGAHELRFRSLQNENVYGTGTVAVDGTDSAFLHTMGENSPGGTVHTVGGLASAFGFIGVVGGGALLFTGAVINANGNPDSTDRTTGPTLVTAGEVTLGIGAALFAIGVVMLMVDHPKAQDGSSSQFSLGDSSAR